MVTSRDAFFRTLGGFIRFKRLKLCFKRIIANYNFFEIIKVINYCHKSQVLHKFIKRLVFIKLHFIKFKII